MIIFQFLEAKTKFLYISVCIRDYSSIMGTRSKGPCEDCSSTRTSFFPEFAKAHVELAKDTAKVFIFSRWGENRGWQEQNRPRTILLSSGAAPAQFRVWICWLNCRGIFAKVPQLQGGLETMKFWCFLNWLSPRLFTQLPFTCSLSASQQHLKEDKHNPANDKRGSYQSLAKGHVSFAKMAVCRRKNLDQPP